MPSVQHPRGTLAALDALAASNGLMPGQIYLVTDQSRLVVALTVSTYQAHAKVGEGGGLPAGGTTGQVLTKASATDGDVNWQTPSGGGGGFNPVLAWAY